MNEKELVFKRSFLAFRSFIIFMFIAGISMAIVSLFVQFFFFSYRALFGDPNIGIETFFKSFLSILTDPLDAVISGIIIYPLYKFIMKKYLKINIKIKVIESNDQKPPESPGRP